MECERFERKSEYLICETQHQESRGAVKVEIVCLLRETESISMKKQRPSVSQQGSRQRQRLRSLKTLRESCPRGLQTRDDGSAKGRNRSRGQMTLPWAFDLQGSDGGSFVISDTELDEQNEDGHASDAKDKRPNGYVTSTSFWDPTDSPKSEDLISVSDMEEQKLAQSDSAVDGLGLLESVSAASSVSTGSVAEDHSEGLDVREDGVELKSGDAVTPLPPLATSYSTELGLHNSDDSCSSSGFVESGPSTPCAALSAVLCQMCQRLTSMIRRQGHLKPKARDKDPASLSCDMWVLKKPWRPRRLRHVKGRLWVHLKMIRKQAFQTFPKAVQTLCPRPHMFLQRNLLHCKLMALKLNDPGQGKTQTVGGHKGTGAKASFSEGIKRKRSVRPRKGEKEQPHCADISINKADDSEVYVRDAICYSETHIQENVVNDLERKAVCQDGQDECDDLERTRRVLNFDNSPKRETMETRRSSQPLQSAARGQSEGTPAAPLTKSNRSKEPKDLHCMDLDRFRDPVDVVCLRSEQVNGFKDPQKGSFRSMLATLERRPKRVIQEYDAST